MVGGKVGGLVLIVAPDPFYLRSPVLVAPDLIGCFVAHAGVTVEIVETEAYLGADDAASHARSGPTVRSSRKVIPSGSAPARNSTARLVDSSTVKLPVMMPEPPGIWLWITGALITSSSSTMAKGEPMFSAVYLPNLRA